MADRFLTLTEFYARAGGTERVQRLAPQSEGGVDVAAVTAAKERGEVEAFSRLSARYPTQLPTTPATTPDVLKDVVARAALYHLAAASRDLVAEELRRGYDDALSWYRDVVAGRANLDLAPAAAIDRSAPQILASKAAADFVFAGGALDDW
jgi:phage gp36-like protein